MKKPLASILLLMAPCLALMAMAFYLTRRAAVAPSVVSQSGPLRVEVVGIETQKTLPADFYDGYDRRLHLVYKAEGTLPKGWGKDAGSWSSNAWSEDTVTNTKFWLERAGKREKLAPLAARISTTRWDEDKERYFHEITFKTDAVPDDAALKVSGVGQIAPLSLPKFGPPIPFEFTLKKAGQKWEVPSISKDTGVTIQKIEVKRPVSGQTTATVTLLLAPGVDMNRSNNYSPQFLSPDWSEGDVSIGASHGGSPQSASSRRIIYDMEWTTNQVSNSQRRDLILVNRLGFDDRWPLEIAFPVKKDGKSIFGVVQPLTRPSGKPPLR